MRVGVDARSLATPARRGVGRVTFELLAAMASRYPEDEWRVLMPGSVGEAPAGTRIRRTTVNSRALFGAGAVIGRPRLDVLLGGVDVVWLPAPAPVAVSPSVPTVLTLHDLSWEERPADFTAYERLWHLLARPRAQARRAARLVAVSEHTRQVAIEHWRLDPERIMVVAPPVSAHRAPAASRAETGATPYFLWVGALEPRKAPDVLATAWQLARGQGLHARLVVVGEGRVPLDGPGIERRGATSDAELALLYERALAVVLPSWLEGAGLVPIEAALHGTPAICSDIGALRESLGPDGAEWTPPGDADALASALLRLSVDDARRERIAQAAARAAAPRVDAGPPAILMRSLLAQAAREETG
jgi:glycosyltransferase involved in cell wall biosynthesis